MKFIINQTYDENGNDISFDQAVLFEPDVEEVENEVVNLYPEVNYETFEGFGGAITDAAGYIFSQMSEEDQKKVIHTYFSKEEMNYRLVRIHMDSCDFSVDQYEAMSDPTDTELKSFSFARTEKYIMPMLEIANREAEGQLRLMLTPWSPPAFMKTNGNRNQGGHLKPEYRAFWAEYLCRYIEEFRSRGYYVERISLQNEAKAVQTWDSCIYSAEEEKDFLSNYMMPAMKAHGLEDIEVFIWDHNKERAYERLRDSIDEKTDKMITGVACHWYSGDHFEALRLIKERYPDKKLILSESCLEYSKFGKDGAEENIGRLTHEIMGDLSHGMCAFYDWNLLLDEMGGPNHVGNFCHAPFLYDTMKKQLMPQKTLDRFAHFSKYIEQGDRRIAVTKYTDDLEAVAYINESGEIHMVMSNRTDSNLRVNLRLNGMRANIMLAPKSVLSGRIM